VEIPDYSLVMGVPGKVVKRLPEELIEKLKWGAAVYVAEAKKYLAEEGFEL